MQAWGLGHGMGLWLQHIPGGHGRSGQQGHDLQQQLDNAIKSVVKIMMEASFIICGSADRVSGIIAISSALTMGRQSSCRKA